MSLRFRLVLLITLAIISAVVAQSVLGLLEFQRVAYQDLDGDLSHFLGLTASRIESLDDLETLDTNSENQVTRSRIVDGPNVLVSLGETFPKVDQAITAIPSSSHGWRVLSLALPGLGAHVRLEGTINSHDDEKSFERYNRLNASSRPSCT
jgi:hypothetical protein